jgi:hypothetical protein
VQTQLWDRIASADLVFCDLTGQNPNVMFEAGVCAALKRIEQVIFLRDVFYRPDQPFDIAPFRYIQYQFTSDGVPAFDKSIRRALEDVVIGFPDREIGARDPSIDLPFEIDFADNRDDQRLITAPLSHRRVRSGGFEFGSLWSFPHSWATIGKTRFSTFALEFDAMFAKLHPNKDHGYIGVGFRSHNPLVPFCHVVYLNRNGSIKLAQPDETVQEGFVNIELRGPTAIQPEADQHFKVILSESNLSIEVDGCQKVLSVSEMPKLLSPGLIRFQAHLAWMGIRRIKLASADPARLTST